MKQEDKRQLLLKVLSTMLPYGVILKTPQGDGYLNEVSLNIFGHKLGINIKATERTYFKLEECKPYLRPMSSMTEKEKKELKTLFDAEEITSDSICYLEGGTLEEYLSHISYSFCSKIIDWLNAHHFDYRGLIPMGLAIEVTKENNPYEDINL